jgi:isocitrate/isopropylmalate dehydrogenase
MTEECRIKYIQYLQCSYSDLVQSYTNKLKIGKFCDKLEMNILIVRSYIESLYSYNTQVNDTQSLDDINCLTEKEICSIVNHAIELLKDCKC